MLKYRSFASICFVFLLSLIFVTTSGMEIKAESSGKIDKKTKEMSVGVEQNILLSQMAGDPTQTLLSGEKKEDKKSDEDKLDVEEEQDLMEKALDLLEIADNYWKNGDIENTINTLDKAYALLLDTNGDVEIARQKDDLRLLISRRILTLYSSRQTKTNGKASEIPHLINADVEKEIRSFQGPERDFFIASYQRSGMYKEIIVGELKKAGIPEELFWLPLVESGFKVSALSPARALGLWQFIPSTGYKYGLNRDEWVEERMDIVKSTRAAIAYLKDLHSMFGDWMTVLAAYNCGEGRVLRVIARQRVNYFDRFWDLYSQLPNETARYVPRFLATLHIINDPKKYGFDLGNQSNSLANYEAVKVQKMMKLSDVAEKLEVSEDVLNLLNAELRYKITPDRVYEIKIPQGTLQKFNLVFEDIREADKPRFSLSRSNYLRHRVRPGETVASIAKRYRVSSEAVYDCNGFARKKKLRKGQVVRIPVHRLEVSSSSAKQASPGSKKHSVTAKKQTYKVKKGDSIVTIARKFNISVVRLKEMNNLKTNSIKAGSVLKIPADDVENVNVESKDKANDSVKTGEKPVVGKTLTEKEAAQLGADKHIVTKGENLSMIAKKYDMELARLIQINHLSGEETLTPGQVLVVK